MMTEEKIIELRDKLIKYIHASYIPEQDLLMINLLNQVLEQPLVELDYVVNGVKLINHE